MRAVIVALSPIPATLSPGPRPNRVIALGPRPRRRESLHHDSDSQTAPARPPESCQWQGRHAAIMMIVHTMIKPNRCSRNPDRLGRAAHRLLRVVAVSAELPTASCVSSLLQSTSGVKLES